MEKWKDVKDYEGLYKVSNEGRIKQLERIVPTPNGGHYVEKEKIKKLNFTGAYLMAALCKNGKVKKISVHRLVLNAFCGESDLQCNHKNGIKTDNRLDNLEWTTQSENMKHAYSTGLQIHPKGEDWHSAKLTEDQVREIKFVYKTTKPARGYITKVAKALKVDHHTISDIILEKTWTHIEI